ncbi:glucose-6-phosphate dehydrogenase [Paracoccus sp. S-4012]|uniref:glucose-6-phosphate dehydrogenase n=1 Tax=Paracoccus sp. S-4012 TaxID=2665648 RepID=UPI0018A23ADA|nr:glucose-6-phosphate dehydrogenase [Paracoccus sp. S-4012]
MILFGATGDLAGRFLFPALAALKARGDLPHDFSLIGCASSDWNDTRFRRHAAHRLGEHAEEVETEIRDWLLDTLSYRRMDIKDAPAVADLVREDEGPFVAYIALPASLFPDAIRSFGTAGMPPGSRLVLEKPFGEDLASARALNALLSEEFGADGEKLAYRVDHVLGMTTVANLMALRSGNRLFDQLWNGRDIAEIEILWEETLALEGRDGFFDQTGTLRDVIQNHVLQLLALTGMEWREGDLATSKRDLLAAIPEISVDRLDTLTCKGRYIGGWLADGRYVGDYENEKGVDPDRGTETFAEVLLSIKNDRWQGVPVRLRAGKALAARRKAVIVRFRPPEHETAPARMDELSIGIDGPRTTELRLAGNDEEDGGGLVFQAPPPTAERAAYGNVLADILSGGSKLSVSGGEAEEAWRILDPVLRSWREDRARPEDYRAGSKGPERLPFGTADGEGD